MVGLSHKALRLVIRSYLPTQAITWWPTEMLNSRKLPYEDLSITPETFKGSDETEMCPQILGNDPELIALSVKKLEEWGASAIDINMGCPVTKALKHNYGVALMGDIGYASDVVRWTKASTHLPVSVKLRAGFQEDFDYLLNFVNALIDAGVDWVTLHPRVAGAKRRGFADWSQIQKLRKRVSIPIVGNGDIQTAQDVFDMIKETQCDSVMSGRALAARPWMVAQVAKRLGYSVDYVPETPEEEAREYIRVLMRLLDLLIKDHQEGLALRKFRFHVRMTHVWLDFGHRLYADITKAKNTEETFGVLRYYQSHVTLKMVPKTELRQ
jgi:tRNA-dihydrouridine synthase